MSLPSSISGFAVLPVLYNSSATHYLYVRAHSGSSGKAASGRSGKRPDTLPDGRTLFLVNVPPDATERELTLFFKHAGTVEKVVFGLDRQQEDDSSSDEEDPEDVSMDEDSDEEESGSGRRKASKKKQDDKPKLIPIPSQSPPVRKLRKTGRSAHIVFLDASSLERALASTSKPRVWPCQPQPAAKSSEEPIGLARYQALYTSLRPPLPSVQAFADSSMEVYEYNLAKEKEKSQSKYKKGEAIVDEDGFTLVTRGGAYGKTLGGGVGVASKKFQRSVGQGRTRSSGEKKRIKAKEGFYAFQKAEKQRSDLMELKRKWEDDKAKVEKLKASRRFKPY